AGPHRRRLLQAQRQDPLPPPQALRLLQVGQPHEVPRCSSQATMSGLLPDYSNQARTYDDTRTASASVLAALRDAIGVHPPAPGARLLDVGGGTGNYAAAL